MQSEEFEQDNTVEALAAGGPQPEEQPDLEPYITEPQPKKKGGKATGINLASGKWSQSGWDSVDLYEQADYAVDLKNEAVPVSDSTYENVFCSHFLEHCTDEEALNVLMEAHRILKKDGVCRVSVPYLTAAFRAYEAADESFFENGGVLCKGPNLETKLCNFFASYSKSEGAGGPYIDPGEFRKRYGRKLPSEIAEEAISLLDRSKSIEHQNWFDAQKLIAMMEAVGFRKVVKSEYGKSRSKEMQGKNFDNRPRVSLFVEGIK